MEQAVPVVLGWGRQGYIKGRHEGGEGRGGGVINLFIVQYLGVDCGLWTMGRIIRPTWVVSLFISLELLYNSLLDKPEKH